MDQANSVWTLFSEQIPVWLKICFTLFVCVLVPVYWVQYGPINFLWFSDVALLLTVPALWLEDSLLASMVTLSVGLLNLAWIIDFFYRLITGTSISGLSSYMFNPQIKRGIRALSLFHLALPVLLVWMVYRLGYDRRAFVAQTSLAWVILLSSYLLSKPSKNVNWVYGVGSQPQKWMSPGVYLALLMILFPLIIYLPMHFLLKGLFS